MKSLEKFKNLGEILSKAQQKKILGGYGGGGGGGCYTSCGSNGCVKGSGIGWTNCTSDGWTCYFSGGECY